jgi:hypothetical protein
MSKEDFSVNGLKKVLSIEDMLSAPNTQFKEVEAWGGIVRLGSLNAEELIEFVEGNENPKSRRIAGIRMIIHSLVNDAGERIGTEAHVPAFLKKDAATTNKLVEAVMELSGMREPKVKEVKNASGEVSTDASPSSSPSASVM